MKKDVENSAAAPAKTAKKKKSGVGFFKRIGRFLKDTSGEVKKLSWPTKKELLGYTAAVISFIALMAVIMWVLDLGFSTGIGALANIGK